MVLVVVAGPVRPTRRRVTFVREWPIHGGPVVGIASTGEPGAEPMMNTWVNAVCAQPNLPADVNVDVILDVARVSARNIERPAAPVTTFLLGVAVADGMDVSEAAAKTQDLAATGRLRRPRPAGGARGCPQRSTRPTQQGSASQGTCLAMDAPAGATTA
jgi:hypothetical protein